MAGNANYMKSEIAIKILDLVRRNYEEIAVDFDLTRQKEIWPELKNLAASVRDGDRVLDAGCGNGRLLNALSGKKIDYLGVDNNVELLELAAKNHPGFHFVRSDLLSLAEIPADNFTHIFCLAVLQHIPSRELRLRVLRGLKSKLAANGQIVLSVWNLWSAVKGREKYHRLIIKTGLASLFGLNPYGRLDFGDLIFPWKNSRGAAVSLRYYHAFTSGELRRLARAVGLRIVWEKREDFNYWLILK